MDTPFLSSLPASFPPERRDPHKSLCRVEGQGGVSPPLYLLPAECGQCPCLPGTLALSDLKGGAGSLDSPWSGCTGSLAGMLVLVRWPREEGRWVLVNTLKVLAPGAALKVPFSFISGGIDYPGVRSGENAGL